MQIQGFRCWNMIFKWWLLHTLIYRRVFHIREMGLANPKSWWCLNQVWFLSWHYHITTLVMVAKTFFHSLLYISLSLCVWMLVLFKWWKLRLFGGKSSRDSLFLLRLKCFESNLNCWQSEVVGCHKKNTPSFFLPAPGLGWQLRPESSRIRSPARTAERSGPTNTSQGSRLRWVPGLGG